jgi:hypothetical protein
MITITREQFKAFCRDLAPAVLGKVMWEDDARKALKAAGIEVERSAEERIEAFVADARPFMASGDVASVVRQVARHFPEVRS